MAVEKSEVEIFKPRNDKREYRRIVLPNSLEVLLISDPETDKAAASMVVSVGSFCDPEGLEGLAHFLEHMLFYASEKYPVEDSYSKYITERGGSTNAFTSSEDTNFYFDINANCLEEALDRFAQFFISPLMSPDATLREIKSVDSENQNNLLSDSWRISQLQKHLSSKDHPYHKFSTGNWDTLEVKPKAKGLDTRLELIKFYEETYSANLMHLAVYGRENLDYLQSLVNRQFREIRNTGREFFHFPGHPCSSEHLQILVKTVPIRQNHILRVLWPITPSILNYKEGSCVYLCHLIGHEGEGSIFYVLKQLGWAISLTADEGDCNFEFSFFYVGIELTDKGQEHMEDIVGLLFKYVLLLQESGVNKWIFDELVTISEMGFHYRDKVPSIGYVVNIASNMKIFPPKDWLVAFSLPSNFVPSTINQILSELSPENVRIFWESKAFDGSTNLVEPWYGTPYSIEKITASVIQKWVEKTPDVNLHLPKPNVFIPSDLSIKLIPEKDIIPVLLRKSLISRLWYKPDTMFYAPRAYIIIDFNCPYSNLSPESSVLTDIYTRLLVDYLNDYAYDAEIAGLGYAIYQTGSGFQVYVYGYNDKIKILLDTIISKIQQFEVKSDRFSVIKESVLKLYQNFKFAQPSDQALYYCSLMLVAQSWPWYEELEALLHLEANHLAEFSSRLLEKTFLECYIAGNIQKNEAESIVQHIEDTLFSSPNPMCKPLFPSEYPSYRIVKLEKGVRYYYPIECLNPNDENSAIVHYIQVHQDNIKLNVQLQLFTLIAKQAAFYQLRSVEQLGYITILCQRSDSGVRGVQFIIQSAVKDPAYLDVRLDAFLKLYQEQLYGMTDEDYKSNVTALIDMKLEKDKNLSEESSFFWSEIAGGTLNFDRIETEVAALKELKKEELMSFFDTYIKVDAPRRRVLSIQVYGALHAAEYKTAIQNVETPQTYQIKDVCSFRRSRPLYGSFKGGLSHMKL